MEEMDLDNPTVKLDQDIFEHQKRNYENESRQVIKRAILDHLCTSDNVLFRIPGKKEDELTSQQKFEIANKLLSQSYGLFLAKFGNQLLQEHLCYFENASEEECVIVNIYLNQLKNVFKLHESVAVPIIPVEEMEVSTEQNNGQESKTSLRNLLLDHLSLNTQAHFRSQQVGEPDLTVKEKRRIAESLLGRSCELFLARFGTHLLEQHLNYFNKIDSYEVNYHLNHLRRNHCKDVSKVETKNRRFEALKKMVDEGSYFSESEMRNRNPLLYEQLVGRFLTPEERKERLNNVDSTNTTFSNILLEHIDQEAVNKLQQEQQDAEDDEQVEHECSDDEMDADYDDSEEDNDLDKSLWGECYTDDTKYVKKKQPKYDNKSEFYNKNKAEISELSDTEKQLLMEEFRSHMFSNFLQGKDVNFDYSKVDNNSDYDNLQVQTQDAEERYFDDESPQDEGCNKFSDGEDVLDEYLKGLKPEPTPGELANILLKMNTGNS